MVVSTSCPDPMPTYEARALAILVDIHPEGLSTREILSEFRDRTVPAFTDPHYLLNALRTLESEGLVERVFPSQGSPSWKLTEKGQEEVDEVYDIRNTDSADPETMLELACSSLLVKRSLFGTAVGQPLASACHLGRRRVTLQGPLGKIMAHSVDPLPSPSRRHSLIARRKSAPLPAIAANPRQSTIGPRPSARRKSAPVTTAASKRGQVIRRLAATAPARREDSSDMSSSDSDGEGALVVEPHTNSSRATVVSAARRERSSGAPRSRKRARMEVTGPDMEDEASVSRWEELRRECDEQKCELEVLRAKLAASEAMQVSHVRRTGRSSTVGSDGPAVTQPQAPVFSTFGDATPNGVQGAGIREGASRASGLRRDESGLISPATEHSPELYRSPSRQACGPDDAHDYNLDMDFDGDQAMDMSWQDGAAACLAPRVEGNELEGQSREPWSPATTVNEGVFDDDNVTVPRSAQPHLRAQLVATLVPQQVNGGADSPTELLTGVASMLKQLVIADNSGTTLSLDSAADSAGKTELLGVVGVLANKLEQLKELSSVRASLEAAEVNASALNDALVRSRAEVLELRTRNDTLTTERDEAASSFDAQFAQLSGEAQKHRESAVAERDMLAESLSGAMSQAAGLELQLEEVGEQMNRLAAEKTSADSRIDELKEAIRTMTAQSDQSNLKEKVLADQLNEFRQREEDAREKTEAFESLALQNCAQIQGLESALKDEKEVNAERIAELENELDLANAALQDMRVEKEQLELALAQREEGYAEARAELEGQIQRLGNEIDGMRATARQRESVVQDLHARLESEQQSFVEVAEEMRESRAQVDRLREEVRENEDRIGKLESSIGQRQMELEAAEAHAVELRLARAAVERSLQAAMEEHAQQIKVVTDERDLLNRQKLELGAKLEEGQRELTILESNFRGVQSERNQLEADFSLSQASREQLANRLEKYRTLNRFIDPTWLELARDLTSEAPMETV